ncbi:MAG TPA: FG-GAP-like repeat-containing protein [Candidatus Thermoplasmatota archaeon]|nr:FG-GAP-like repeat-containing protein [Candidatus Thermoplasmatota archaeon]
MRAFVLVLLLLVPVAAAQVGWPIVRVIERDEFEAFDAASLNLFDFDGDGDPEIVSSNDNGHVYVIDMRSGRVRADIETTHPDGWEARDINPVSIGDLYGDGTPCLVIPNSAAYLAAWCYDGRTVLGGFDFDKRWETRVDAARWDPGFADAHPWLADQQPSMDGNAFLADVDGKPGLEIFVETDGYPGQFSFGHDGEQRWQNTFWDGNAGATVADLDLDGRKEAIFASDAGVISVYDADTGKRKWTFESEKHGASPGSIPLAPMVADIAGDPQLELVFAARGATSGLDGSHATWFALAADGGVLWQRSEAWMNPLAYDHPAPIDVDGDGALDVVALDWNTIGHKPGNWETTARGPSLFALRGTDGRALWHTSVPAYWSNKDFVIVGDDLIVEAPSEGVDGLGVYDLRTGKPTGWTPLPEGWDATRGPVAARAHGGIFVVVPLQHADAGPATRHLDVGHRQGALAVVHVDTGGALRWSANFLQSDAAPPPAPRPWFGLVLGVGAFLVAGGGLLAWRRFAST